MPSSSDFAGGVADREVLERALQRLDPRHRAVIVLHYYLGMPMPEVAFAMGIPLGRPSRASTTHSPRCGHR